MEYLPWIILDLVSQKDFMDIFPALTRFLMMSLSITPKLKVLWPVYDYYNGILLFWKISLTWCIKKLMIGFGLMQKTQNFVLSQASYLDSQWVEQ